MAENALEAALRIALPDDDDFDWDLRWDNIMLPEYTARWERTAEQSMKRAQQAADAATMLKKIMRAAKYRARDFDSPLKRLTAYLVHIGRDDLAALVMLAESVEPLLRQGWLTREMKCGAGVGSFQKWWKFT